MSDNDKIKLTNVENNYITMVNGKPKLKGKRYSKNQLISYNAQGELMINDKCLTKNQNEIVFSDCTKQDNQMWKIYEDKISPSADNNKCLTSNNEEIILSECNNTDVQSWNMEYPDINKTTDTHYPEQKGRSVVLVDSDNPWYLNIDTTIPLLYDTKLNLENMKYKNHADIEEYNKKRIEHFENTNNTDDNVQTHILILLGILIIILGVYKLMKR
jgi:hypothetical protein